MQQKFHREISAQHIWSVPNLLRGRPTDLSSSFLHRQCSNSDTVTQAWQLHKVWTSYQIYTWISWFFSQKSHFQVISDVQWWKQISTHFSDSTHQECMIFARIGNGPCYCHWNEICAGVSRKNDLWKKVLKLVIDVYYCWC